MRVSSSAGVGAVVPQVRVGVRAGEGAGVFVGDEEQAGFFGGGEDFVEGFMLVGAGGELAVAVVDGDLVPDPDVLTGRRGRGLGRPLP